MSDTDEFGRKFYFCEDLDRSVDSKSDTNAWFKEQETADKDHANLVSSICADGMHRPVLDFDFPCRLIPSTTPGNGHLYIDKPMTWEAFEALLTALRDAGLLQPGFVKNSIKRKATFVRPPWIKKQPKDAP